VFWTNCSAMSDLAPFIDLELAVIQTVTDLGSTGTVTPPTLETSTPFIRVSRIGGPSDRFMDFGRIDVDCFGATRGAAYSLAETCRQRLINVPHAVTAGIIDSVITDSGPHEIPWGDPKVRCFTASYTVTARR
jgi:hypothetical protein